MFKTNFKKGLKEIFHDQLVLQFLQDQKFYIQ